MCMAMVVITAESLHFNKNALKIESSAEAFVREVKIFFKKEKKM